MKSLLILSKNCSDILIKKRKEDRKDTILIKLVIKSFGETSNCSLSISFTHAGSIISMS